MPRHKIHVRTYIRKTEEVSLRDTEDISEIVRKYVSLISVLIGIQLVLRFLFKTRTKKRKSAKLPLPLNNTCGIDLIYRMKIIDMERIERTDRDQSLVRREAAASRDKIDATGVFVLLVPPRLTLIRVSSFLLRHLNFLPFADVNRVQVFFTIEHRPRVNTRATHVTMQNTF